MSTLTINQSINPSVGSTALTSVRILDEFSRYHLYVWRVDRQITPTFALWMIEIVCPDDTDPLIVQARCFNVGVEDAIARLGTHFDLLGCDVNHWLAVPGDF